GKNAGALGNEEIRDRRQLVFRRGSVQSGSRRFSEHLQLVAGRQRRLDRELHAGVAGSQRHASTVLYDSVRWRWDADTFRGRAAQLSDAGVWRAAKAPGVLTAFQSDPADRPGHRRDRSPGPAIQPADQQTV